MNEKILKKNEEIQKNEGKIVKKKKCKNLKNKSKKKSLKY